MVDKFFSDAVKLYKNLKDTDRIYRYYAQMQRILEMKNNGEITYQEACKLIKLHKKAVDSLNNKKEV